MDNRRLVGDLLDRSEASRKTSPTVNSATGPLGPKACDGFLTTIADAYGRQFSAYAYLNAHIRVDIKSGLLALKPIVLRSLCNR